MVSEERAKGACKVLRWIKEAAPRKKEREEAAGLLKLLSGIKVARQVILTRGQEEMLTFVLDEFPVVEPTQLSMFGPQEEVLLSRVPGRGPEKVDVRGRPGQVLPKPTTTTKSELKGKLTEEDKEARRSIGLSDTPSDVPLDSSGRPIRTRIAEILEETAATERQFGKAKLVGGAEPTPVYPSKEAMLEE